MLQDTLLGIMQLILINILCITFQYFHDKKFLDVILVVENGNHMIQCHKIVKILL